MAKTGHPNFVYEITSPWRVGTHKWGLTGNHSGSSFDATDAQTFMTGTGSPFYLCFRHFINPVTTGGALTANWVTAAKYYDGINSAPVWEATYSGSAPPPSNLVPTGDAFAEPGAGINLPLETCMVLEAPCGISATSKPIFLRKYIHAVPQGNLEGVTSDTEINWTLSSGAPGYAAALGNGTMFGSRVICSPNGRQATGSGWAPVVAPGNHQMPRGRKRKKVAVGQSALVTLAEKVLEGGVIALTSEL